MDKISIFLVGLTYFTIFLQVLMVFLSSDNSDPDSYLMYHKIYFYIMTLMTIWCHLRCLFTDPGIIKHKNNPAVVEFYLNIHELGVKRAEKFNQAYGDVFFKNMSEDEELKQAEDDEDEISDYDETQYEPVTSITNESMESISNEYKIEFKRCQQCYVVRPPRVHHCSMCKGCVMKMDHHCHWVCNCVGQFTQKFFILFCLYSLGGCWECVVIVLYYMIYKNRLIFGSWLMITLMSFQMFFAIIFILLTICMLNAQWNIIQNDTTMIDMKKKKFLEKRDFNEVLNETFGRGFDLSWFIPYKVGGYRPFFYKLLKGRRRN